MKNRALALAGILTALTVILLYVAMIAPSMKLVLYALTSLPIFILVIEADKRTALLFYLATAILALLILPDKLAALPYVVVLGLYGLVKAWAEQRPNRVWEWLLKMVYFNLTGAIYYILLINIFVPDITWPISLLWLVLAAEVVAVVYDFAYSMVINFYERELRPRLLNRK